MLTERIKFLVFIFYALPFDFDRCCDDFLDALPLFFLPSYHFGHINPRDAHELLANQYLDAADVVGQIHQPDIEHGSCRTNRSNQHPTKTGLHAPKHMPHSGFHTEFSLFKVFYSSLNGVFRNAHTVRASGMEAANSSPKNRMKERGSVTWYSSRSSARLWMRWRISSLNMSTRSMGFLPALLLRGLASIFYKMGRKISQLMSLFKRSGGSSCLESCAWRLSMSKKRVACQNHHFVAQHL